MARTKECLECGCPLIGIKDDPLGILCDGCYEIMQEDEII